MRANNHLPGKRCPKYRFKSMLGCRDVRATYDQLPLRYHRLQSSLRLDFPEGDNNGDLHRY